MTHEIDTKTFDQKTSSKPQFDENRRYLGVVKFFKESGYGFFRVPSLPDVFFHIRDLQRTGLTSTASGDKFTFKVKKNSGKDGYRAFYIDRYDGGDEVIQKKSAEDVHSAKSGKQSNRKDGNSGSLVAIPHPKDIRQNMPKKVSYEIMPQNGEIVVRNLNSEKMRSSLEKPKPITMKSGILKIGPPCHLSLASREISVVSATGPNSAEMSPSNMNPEIENLKEVIDKKKTIFRSLNVERLPDGGRRLRDDISALEKQLRDLIIKEKSVERTGPNHRSGGDEKENTYPAPTKIEKKKSVLKSAFDTCPLPRQQQLVGADGNVVGPVKIITEKKLIQGKLEITKSEYLGARIGENEFAMYEPILFSDTPLYGGRMTATRLTEVRKVTKAAIEDLHKSLSTRPEPEGELADPLGLKVSLMLHQKQALAWLVWREAQTMSGGILADDMGLGKTLTMISLILTQKENEEGNANSVKEEYAVEDFDSSSGSLDSNVNLVKDARKDAKTDVKENKNEPCADAIKKEEKGQLVASDSTLIVAPASLLFHWEKEIRNRCDKGLLSIHLFHGASREKEPTRLAEFDVVITTYDIVRKCGSARENSSKDETTLMAISWRRVILDEAHHIKNFKSQSSEAVCKLVAKTRWAMSGTPVQNNLTDMYAMLKFLHCRPFDEYKVWKNQVDNKTQNGRERLKTLISCIVLRREKSNTTPTGSPLVDLPKRTFLMHRLKLGDVEREVYEKLQSDSKAAFRKFQENKKGNATVKSFELNSQGVPSSINEKDDSITATTLLVMLLRLRQCCGHLSLLKETFDPELLSNEKKEFALEDLFHSMDINKTPVQMADIHVESYVPKDKKYYFDKSSMSGKLEFVLDELNKLRFENPGDKSVIVSQWTSMLEVIACHLDKSEISYSIIKGSVSAKKRMNVVDEFNRNPVRPMVLLLSLQAGGVGLNLVGGNHLFLLDMHWNPALESQAFDRIYRVGQKKSVFIHKFVVEETVEERILKLQEHKLSLAKAVMQGVGSDECKKLSLQDMKLLFGI